MTTDEFYLQAFCELSTCRMIGMGPGPIPWDKIVLYAGLYGLDSDNTEFFIEVIRHVDQDYLVKAAEDKPIEKKDAKMGRQYRQK